MTQYEAMQGKMTQEIISYLDSKHFKLGCTFEEYTLITNNYKGFLISIESFIEQMALIRKEHPEKSPN